MAKIFDRIDGYAEMSAEDKLKALEGMELEDNSAEIERLRKAVSKANSEASEWKKKHNELLSEDERSKQAQEETLASLKTELETLRKEKTVSEFKSKYLSLGFEDKLAQETALAMADGDIEKVFANQKKANDALVQSAIAAKLKGTPRPGSIVTGGSGMDYAKEISEAQSRGDIAAAAYYTRLQAQAETQSTQ